ncbi:MAG: CDP-alcohol phosphatidyltransferase family protein [Magnetococcales bacterium]|nr:CDP-alcohol phosphatidyltransferase family protein [Magnetococcales bacterium]
MSDNHSPLVTPNQITITRFLLIGPLFYAWFASESINFRMGICYIFVLIFVADAWDGLIARKYNMGSVFGVYFDPIVDHISYFALCIMLISEGFLSLWFLFIIIARDLLVVFVKQYAGASRVVIKASFLAKVKADLVSVPLACLYIINVVDPKWQLYVVVAIGLYLLAFKFIFDPTPEHTVTLRGSIIFLALVFFFRPDSIPLPQYYEQVYVVMAIFATVGSALLYFWNSKALFFPDTDTVEK